MREAGDCSVGQMVGSLMFGRFKIPNILKFWVFGCLCVVCWPLQWPFTKGTKKRRQCERVCFWRILQIGCLFRVPLYVRACPSSGPTNEERRLKPVVRYRPLGVFVAFRSITRRIGYIRFILLPEKSRYIKIWLFINENKSSPAHTKHSFVPPYQACHSPPSQNNFPSVRQAATLLT